MNTKERNDFLQKYFCRLRSHSLSFMTATLSPLCRIKFHSCFFEFCTMIFWWYWLYLKIIKSTSMEELHNTTIVFLLLLSLIIIQNLNFLMNVGSSSQHLLESEHRDCHPLSLFHYPLCGRNGCEGSAYFWSIVSMTHKGVWVVGVAGQVGPS